MTNLMTKFLVLIGIMVFVACGGEMSGTSGKFFEPQGLIDNDDDDDDDTPMPDVRLYATMSDHSGNLGGRTGADAICQSAMHATLVEAGYEARSFLSFSAADEIQDMPTLYGIPVDLPILNVSGMPVANDWGHLLSGGLVQSLRDAGVMGSNDYFWSGSSSNGAAAAVNCNGFTSSASNVFGASGYSQATDSTWTWTQSVNCLSTRKILCVAF